MGTLATAITRARIRGRDTAKTLLTDEQLLALVNGALETIHGELANVQSSLVTDSDKLATEAGKGEYTAGFRFESVSAAYIEGDPAPLSQVPPEQAAAYAGAASGRPVSFYLGNARRVGLLPVPDAAYTVRFYHHKPLVELTDLDNGDLPFDGIFDRVVEDMLTVDILGINERDTTYAAGLLAVNWEKAMNRAFARGVAAKRMPVPEMFCVEGL